MFVILLFCCCLYTKVDEVVFVAFVEDNVTMSSIRYFENYVLLSYFLQD